MRGLARGLRCQGTSSGRPQRCSLSRPAGRARPRFRRFSPEVIVKRLGERIAAESHCVHVWEVRLQNLHRLPIEVHRMPLHRGEDVAPDAGQIDARIAQLLGDRGGLSGVGGLGASRGSASRLGCERSLRPRSCGQPLGASARRLSLPSLESRHDFFGMAARQGRRSLQQCGRRARRRARRARLRAFVLRAGAGIARCVRRRARSSERAPQEAE